MNRKTIYTLTLFVFIAMWGVFGFATAPAAGAEPALQDTLAPTVVVPTVVVTVVNQTVIPPAIGVTQVVPVTGTAGPNIMMLLFYGFLGLLAIVLLVALFASANRTTYVRRDGPPPPPDDL
jgi:hypothetical protein